MRRPIGAGNWKMHGTRAECVRLAEEVVRGLDRTGNVDVVLCPPFTALAAVGEALAGSAIALGAQDSHWEPSGAFTGEISPSMLADVGCRYVIVGHSERRTHCAETDAQVLRKARAVLAAGLTPIVCIGETLDERESGRADAVLRRQVEGSLAGLATELSRAVVAYEPVWAIGTGRTATAAEAQEAHALIRRTIGELIGAQIAQRVRIQYGGSLKPANAAALFAGPDVDGGLVGGASLDAAEFLAIVGAAAS